MRKSRQGQLVRSVRPGRFDRPQFRPSQTPERQILVAEMSDELLRLRCLVVELQSALHRIGAGTLADDIHAKYFPRSRW